MLPTDVAVYKSRLYIVDGGHQRIVVTNLKGKYLYSFGQEGAGDGEFQNPVGIGIDEKGTVFVADTSNHRIQIFDTKGAFKSSFQVISEEVLIRPIDIAVDPNTDELYVTGNNNHKLMVFDQSGKLLREWGRNGEDVGEFRFPATVVVTPDSVVAVVDVFNTRAQLFTGAGEYLIEIGKWGVLQGQLVRPKGVAIDNSGLIYISDSYMNVIQVFNDEGKFQYLLKEGDAYQFETPAGITLDKSNRLYVAEMLKHKVSVFQVEK